MSQRGLTVAQAAYNAGFRGQALTTITALGLAESEGNTQAHNYSDATKDDSWGIWQINYYGDLRQSRITQYGQPESLLDPNANAAAAYKMSGGGKYFGDWQADYNNGRYYKFLPEATDSVSQLLGGATAPGALGSPTVNPLIPNATTGFAPASMTTAASSVKDDCILSLPSLGPVGGGCLFHRRALEKILGTFLIMGGVSVAGLGVVLLLARSSTVTGVVGTVTPGGKILAGAVTKGKSASRDREIDRGSKPTSDQARQARQRYRAQTVKDADGEDF